MLVRIVCLLFVVLISCSVLAQDGSEALIEAVVDFLKDQDDDIRALAFEQVRTEAKGEAATKAFAAQLPFLSPEAQTGLIRALARRGDQAARPAVLDVLSRSKQESVRVAAIESMGSLGEADDVQLLMRLLSQSSKAEQAAAEHSLVRLRVGSVGQSLVTELQQTASPIRVALLKILVARRERDTIPAIIAVAADNDAAVRQAAMTALGEIARPEHIPGMLRGVLKADQGKEREAAEKCVMFVCNRVEDPEMRAAPVMAAMKALPTGEQTILLSTLGRVGGSAALKSIEAALAKSSTHSDGLRAICNWPDASVVPRLIELIRTDKHSGHATTALRALIRIAPLRDDRTDKERLELLQRAMTMCTRDMERNLVLDRCRTIRTLDSLKYLFPYVGKPAHTQQACLSIVELAHHRELRDANKAEFHKALDLVLATSKDPVILDRAQRYKKGQTWARPVK